MFLAAAVLRRFVFLHLLLIVASSLCCCCCCCVAAAGRRVCATTGRPLVGASRAAAEVVYPEDAFKVRTTSLQALPLQQKKRVEHTEKPNNVTHWDMSVKRPVKTFTQKRWTDVVIESALSNEPGEILDENGKSRVHDPKEDAPLYSSFSADRIYKGPTASTMRLAKGHSNSDGPGSGTAPRRRRSVYGTPIGPDVRNTTGSDDEEAGDFFDAHHRVDYSRRGRRRPQSQASGRAKTAPAPASSLSASVPLASPIAQPHPAAAGLAPPSQAMGLSPFEGADPPQRPGSRPSSQPAGMSDPPLAASMTRALSRQGRRIRKAGSGLSGSMRGASLSMTSGGGMTTGGPVGVRSGGFDRLTTTVLVAEE